MVIIDPHTFREKIFIQKYIPGLRKKTYYLMKKFKAKVPGHINIKTNITLFESPVAVNLVYPFPLETNKYKSINLKKLMNLKKKYLALRAIFNFNSLVLI